MTISTEAENVHPTVLVIGGLPCSGKSTLAEEIKRRLHWLGWADREWSRRLSRASYAVMLACAKQFLDARTSFIIEGKELREDALPLPLPGQLLELDTTTITNDARVAFVTHVARTVAR